MRTGDSQTSPERLFERRCVILGCLFLAWVLAAAGRLVFLQVLHHDEYVTRALRQQQRTIEVSPKRGIIYDRNFHELAMSAEVDSVFAVPAEIPDPESTAQLLCRVLGMDAADLAQRIKDAKSFCWIKRRIDSLEAERVRSLNLRGIYFQKENKRFYPNHELAAHVLGYVGLDENGLAGVELETDQQVRGRPGKLLVQTDARRRWYARNERPPEPGENIVLTIDNNVQYIAESELQAAMNETHAKAGTVIVMEPNTGEVLAMANQPTFNPNTYAQSDPEAWMNRAVAAAYEPGSTFKIITVAAALEERLTRPDEVVDCQMGSITLFGHRITDHSSFGMLTVNEIIQNSSDVGAIKLGLRLGDERMYRYMRAFGFGAPTGIELPGEARGLTRPADRWTPISIGAISMGQEVGVTPIQLITAASAVANGGRLQRPRILRKSFRNPPANSPGLLFAAGGSPQEAAGATQVISQETSIALKRMMQQVVIAGTGKRAQLNGWTVAGKTGTAQKLDPRTGTYSKSDYVASFTGFAPVNNPAVIILVVLDSPSGPHQGGAVAAPVFKKIAEQVLAYLEVPHDLPVSAGKPRPEVDPLQVADFAPPDAADKPAAVPETKAAASPSDATFVMDLEGAPTVPDFIGKSLRAVAEQAVALGLEVETEGSGIARQQEPSPGGRLLPGQKIIVRLSR
jgi:cell division protein FtsI (penicillin-binding protein 3)